MVYFLDVFPLTAMWWLENVKLLGLHVKVACKPTCQCSKPRPNPLQHHFDSFPLLPKWEVLNVVLTWS